MSIEHYISERSVEGTFRDYLQNLSGSEKTRVETFLHELTPSANALRELLTLAREIAARDGVGLEQVLSIPELVLVVHDSGKNRKERLKLVRTMLEHLRYPHKRQLQEMLDAKVRQVAVSSGLRFTIPEEFEGDAVTISVAAKSVEDLQAFAKRFEQAAQHPDMAEVFAILRGEY